MAAVAMFAALSFVSVLIAKVIPNVAGFLSYEPKDAVIVIAGLLYGPLTSVLISVIVSLIEMLTISSTGPYGFLMNVISTCAFAIPAAWYYQKHKTQKDAVIGLCFGVITMVVAMLLAVGAQFAVNARRTAVYNREMKFDAMVEKGVNILDQANETAKQVKKAEKGRMYATLGSLGVIGAGVALAVGMYLMSEIGDIRVYKIASVVLTVIMAISTLLTGDERSRLPRGSLAALIAMAAGCVLLVFDPFHSDDRAFYLVTAGIMAAVIWECVDLLLVYNRSCSNPMPQFESHTGGEDLA
jgi:riboflavin transporter FmnP